MLLAKNKGILTGIKIIKNIFDGLFKINSRFLKIEVFEKYIDCVRVFFFNEPPDQKNNNLVNLL